MVNSFNRLPLDVWIIILRYAPDLSTIYKFICTSAYASAAFNIDSPHILNAAIERSIPELKHEARMVAILGTFLTSPSSNFESLVQGYKSLPIEVLSAAPASCAFMKGTSGPRYLVLTAYRIETLQHICFVSLLHNIHEALWPSPVTEIQNHFSEKPWADYTEIQNNYSVKKSFKTGIDFHAVGWWSVSGAEKTRIPRAYWNLIIYWNIHELCPDLRADDYDLSKYRATIKRLDPNFEPFSWKPFSDNPVEEMKCVLGVTRDFLSFPHGDSRLFSPFTSRQTPFKFGLEKWVFTTVFKENPCWRFEERKPPNGDTGCCHLMISSNRRDKLPYDYSSLQSNPKPGNDDQFIDYLGVCIWDAQRLDWVANSSRFSIWGNQVRDWTLVQDLAWTRSRVIR